ncbi:DUF2799 domain-containing protein [Vibrio sonorensis]|uniref:DUF2799 domain-containing protein n=1 Tax=Vibrio sonorensis TaxID=1004316 RepID=UPI0008D945FC|nr:DUF2799 domain-containing protein [Vibrio sonorensis]
MRFIPILLIAFTFGCTTMPFPDSADASQWEDLGKQRALNGYSAQSQDRLSKAAGQMVSNELYTSYRLGYEAGRDEYCSQNAYMLGVKRVPYSGVCDLIDPFFKQDYISGKGSTAGARF